MKKKKIIIIGVVLIGAIIAISVATIHKGLETEVVTIQPGDITDTFTEDATVKDGEDAHITSLVNGKVTKVLVKPNQYITKGTIIASVNPKDYDYELHTHENNINAYKAQIEETLHSENNDKSDILYSIKELKAQLKSVTANKKVSDIELAAKNSPEEYINLLSLNLQICKDNYELSKKKYDEYKALYDIGTASANEVELANHDCMDAKAALTKAQTQYDASNTQLKKLRGMGISSDELNKKFYALQDESLAANVENIQTQISALENKLNTDYSSDIVSRLNALIENETIAIKQLKDQVNDCDIKATASGYITELPVQNLSQVSTGTDIATIKPDNSLTISCDVLTSCEPYLHVGDPVVLKQKLKSEDITFTGKIQEIYSFAKQSTSALGLKEHRVEVIIVPDDNSISLKDGYELEVTFTTYAKENALYVPNSATFEMDDKDYVYILKNKLATLTPVTIEHKTNTDSIITSGIKEGDNVIYNANTEGLTNGTRIKPISK